MGDFGGNWGVLVFLAWDLGFGIWDLGSGLHAGVRACVVLGVWGGSRDG